MMTKYLSTNFLAAFIVLCSLAFGLVHVVNSGLSRGLAYFAHFLGYIEKSTVAFCVHEIRRF